MTANTATATNPVTTIAALDSRIAALEPLAHGYARLYRIGCLFSNLAFNLVNDADSSLPQRHRDTLELLRLEWDEVREEMRASVESDETRADA